MKSIRTGPRSGRARLPAWIVAIAMMIAALLVPGVAPVAPRTAWAADPVAATITSVDPVELTTDSLRLTPHSPYLVFKIRSTEVVDTPRVQVNEVLVYVNDVLLVVSRAVYQATPGTYPVEREINLRNDNPTHVGFFASPGVLRIRLVTTYYVTYDTNFQPTSSNEFQIPIVAAGPPPPAAPRILTTAIYPHSPNRAQIRWQDNSSNETGFEIERIITVGDTRAGGKAATVAAPSDGLFLRYAVVGPDVTVFTDKKAFPLSTVSYRVRALLGAVASDASPSATLVTPSPKACRRPSFDLWSGMVRFRDPGDKNQYRMELRRRGSRVVGDVFRDPGNGDPVGRFIGTTSVASPVLEGSIRFTDDEALPTELPGQPLFLPDTRYLLRLTLLTQGGAAYREMSAAVIAPWAAPSSTQELALADRMGVLSVGPFDAGDVPPSWALAEICMKGGASPKKVGPKGTVVFSLALENGGECGIGSGRLALQLAARGGDIVSVESGRGELVSQSALAALVSLPTLGPTEVSGTQRDLLFITVEVTSAVGGTVELDADVFDVIDPTLRTAQLPAAIVVPATRTFAVSVR
ncbi:MAG: hypothetical protein K8T90_16385 [Planctomycetes bacterium]|nr:hypothetical protein [Planctomycetota bacterium]